MEVTKNMSSNHELKKISNHLSTGSTAQFRLETIQINFLINSFSAKKRTHENQSQTNNEY